MSQNLRDSRRARGAGGPRSIHDSCGTVHQSAASYLDSPALLVRLLCLLVWRQSILSSVLRYQVLLAEATEATLRLGSSRR